MVKRAAVVALAGVAVALGFEPFAWFWLIFPGLIVLAWAVHTVTLRQSVLLGFIFGMGFMLTLLPWIQRIGFDAWIGLSALEALFYAAVGLGLRLVAPFAWWPLGSAAVWVLGEELRSVIPFGGFPWGRLAFASIDTPFEHLMSWGSTGVTSAAIAVLGFALAGFFARSKTVRWESLAQTVGVIAVVMLADLFPWQPAASSNAPVQIAAVQGNVPGNGAETVAQEKYVLDNHAYATIDLARQVKAGQATQPDLVLWPESSTDIDPFQSPAAYAEIQKAVDTIGAPVLVGAMVNGPTPNTDLNEGILWLPGTGPSQTYAKRHPVPFGEYIPLRTYLAPLFHRLDQIPRDMVPGSKPGMMPVAGTTLGDLICFEVAYDSLVQDVVHGGAQFLVVQTNNATYMGTGQDQQQFDIARLRAIETGRYVATVATNGISGLIAPDGSVLQQLPVRTTALYQASIPQLTGISPGVQLGVWLRGLFAALGVGAVVIGIIARRRHPRLLHETVVPEPDSESDADTESRRIPAQ